MNLDDFDFDACFKFLKTRRDNRITKSPYGLLMYSDIKMYLVDKGIANVIDTGETYDLAQKITHVFVEVMSVEFLI